MLRWAKNRRGVLAAELALLAVGTAVGIAAAHVARSNMDVALRVPDPGQTYFVGRGDDAIPSASAQDLLDWRARPDVFARVAAFMPGIMQVQGPAVTLVARTAWISSGMRSFLRWHRTAGPAFLPSDFLENVGKPRYDWQGSVAIVSHRLASKLGLQAPLGALLQTSEGTFRIVGILPAWVVFPYPQQPDILVPLTPGEGTPSSLVVLGQLRPNLTKGRAEILLNRPVAVTPGRRLAPVEMAPMQASLDPGAVRASKYGLALAFVVLFMLVATASMHELLDAIRDERQQAIKLALGAPPARLVLERVGRTAGVAAAATIAGTALFLAAWPLISRMGGAAAAGARLDWFVVESALALAALLFLVISTAPLLLGLRYHPIAWLRAESPSLGPGAHRARALVISVQIAASIACCLAAASLANRLFTLESEPLGVSTQNIWNGGLRLPTAAKRLSGPQASAITAQLLTRLRSLPGVANVAFSSGYPGVAFPPLSSTEIAPFGETPVPSNTAHFVTVTFVGPRYLQLLRCPLLAGRYLTAADSPSVPLDVEGVPVILSEPLARRLFGDANPVGRKITFPRSRGRATASVVVGVVAGIRTMGMEKPLTPEIFAPRGASLPWSLSVEGKPSATISQRDVQRAVSAVLPGAQVVDYEPLRYRFQIALAGLKARSGLLALFSILAIAIAALGTAAMLLSIVQEQDLAIGIRRALGASDGRLAAGLIARVLPSVGVGLVAGILCSTLLILPLAPEAASVSALDTLPRDAAVITAALVIIGLALLLPLRRALRRPIHDLLRAE